MLFSPPTLPTLLPHPYFYCYFLPAPALPAPPPDCDSLTKASDEPEWEGEAKLVLTRADLEEEGYEQTKKPWSEE